MWHLPCQMYQALQFEGTHSTIHTGNNLCREDWPQAACSEASYKWDVKCDLCHYSSISQCNIESHVGSHRSEAIPVWSLWPKHQTKTTLKRHQNLYHNPACVPPPRRIVAGALGIQEIPESKTKEKPITLEIWRQEKIFDEVDAGKFSAKKDPDIDCIPMHVENCQYYSVLEVIQCCWTWCVADCWVVRSMVIKSPHRHGNWNGFGEESD